MPVRSERYSKVKLVCDRLAVLAAQCSDDEFEKRFHFLDAVCTSWAQSAHQQHNVSISLAQSWDPQHNVSISWAQSAHQQHNVSISWAQSAHQQHNVLVPASRSIFHAKNADVVDENLSEQSEVDTVTYSEDNNSLADDKTLFTDDGSKQPDIGCVQSQSGMYEHCVTGRCSLCLSDLFNVVISSGLLLRVKYTNSTTSFMQLMNAKNCIIYMLLTATDQKLQKS